MIASSTAILQSFNFYEAVVKPLCLLWVPKSQPENLFCIIGQIWFLYKSVWLNSNRFSPILQNFITLLNLVIVHIGFSKYVIGRSLNWKPKVTYCYWNQKHWIDHGYWGQRWSPRVKHGKINSAQTSLLQSLILCITNSRPKRFIAPRIKVF